MRQSEVPKEIWIAGECWTIKFVKKLNQGKRKLRGLCDPSTRTIYLIQKQTALELADTVFHEIFHAICFEYDFEIAHKHIYKLGEAMGNIWIDNF